MTAELLQLLESLIVSGAVGVLNLGTGARARRVFFTGTEVHLLEPGRECRFIPVPALLENEHISAAVIQELVGQLSTGPGALSQMLAERGLLSPEERQALAYDERLEEILLILERADRYIFEEGNVPEEVLLPSTHTVEISLEELANALRDRLREQLEVDRTIPTVTEVPVVSSRGREVLEAGDHWVFQQIGTRVDGDRTLRDLMKESPYFPHLTRQVLAAAIRQRWLKKTQFTELLELNPFDFSPSQAAEIMNQLEEAIETADDQLPLRRKLSTFSLRAGRVEKAVAELTTIGQFLHERGDTSGAVSGYREALRWEPNAPVARDDLVRLYTEAADRAHDADDLEEEQQYILEALRYRRGDLELYLRAIEGLRDNEARVVDMLPRLLKVMETDPRKDLQMEFMSRLREYFPKSEPIRNRHINLLLDNARTEEAIHELELLAGNHLDAGQKQEADLIYSKIERLRPGQAPSPPAGGVQRPFIERLKDRAFHFHTSRTGTITVVLLLVFMIYHSYAHLLFTELARRANAIAETRAPSLGSHDFGAYQTEAHEVMRQCRSFGRLHFLTLWGTLSRSRANDLEGLILFHETQHDNGLERLVRDAERVDRLSTSRRLYAEVVRLAEGTKWRELAANKLLEIDRYEAQASDLMLEADAASDRDDHSRAFHVVHSLLQKYPRSTAARNVTLPLRVKTIPSGAQLSDGHRVLGTSPILIRVRPLTRLHLEATLSGYRSTTVVIDEPTSPDVIIRLPLR